MNGEEKEKRYICGKNKVLEALKSGQPLIRIFIAGDLDRHVAGQIMRLAAEANIPYGQIDKRQLAKIAGDGARGVAAEAAACDYVDLADILAKAAEDPQPLLLLLDDIEDPHNLGAILRTALAAGATGAIVPKRNAAPLNDTVMRTSAGAVNYLPVARVSNLTQTIEELKKQGFWIIGGDMQGQCLWQVDMSGPIALVMGSEGKGLSPLVRKHCDFIASIPMQGQVGSLNVSVAAGILLYEAARKRGASS
ncbi:MAG: 23S rRNA (guanosine(2251)-2'-O)-methyltransferase RlmB [Firmicutes bacterium]|nr:23S rRNA (guanosine(2251)-2'-O)-methyltransferase RlmB [Bacillota bacterium]